MVDKVWRCPTLSADSVPPRKSSSAARPGMEPTCQNSQAMVVSGSTDLPSTTPASKSTTQSPFPKGLGVRHSLRRRTLHEPATGSQKNSSWLRSDQARFRVNISMNSIMFNKVSPRFSATGGV